MQFIAASLGVECELCHVEHAMDKDDKKEKQTARKIIAMELAIDKGHFEGELEVTCYRSLPTSDQILERRDCSFA